MGKRRTDLIRNIFRYMDKDAKDIMTHRRDIVAIDEEETLENALKFMLDENFSRFPIYREDIDEITGVFHLRDAMRAYLNKSLRETKVKDLTSYIRQVAFIPETKSIDTLFKEMQAEKESFGRCSG
ncbi:MAG: CBS domain-containing protein [Lachnoclostridium sp.]